MSNKPKSMFRFTKCPIVEQGDDFVRTLNTLQFINFDGFGFMRKLGHEENDLTCSIPITI